MHFIVATNDIQLDLIFHPLPPDAADLMQQKSLTAGMKVFYDPTQRATPKDLDDYMAYDHIHVQFAMGRASRDQLAIAPFPFRTQPVSYHMVWHQRTMNVPTHRWLREEVKRIASRWKT